MFDARLCMGICSNDEATRERNGMPSKPHATGQQLVELYGHDGPPSELAEKPIDEPPLETPDIEADLAAKPTPETKSAAGRTRRR